MLGKATGVSRAKAARCTWSTSKPTSGVATPSSAGTSRSLPASPSPSSIAAPTTPCSAIMGDGATNIGYFHESLNLAGVWDLPVLWIVENNQYGMGTSVERASAGTMLQKAQAYGMEGKQVDGMNVIEVYEATKAALQQIRDGEGTAVPGNDDLPLRRAQHGRPAALPHQGRGREVAGGRPHRHPRTPSLENDMADQEALEQFDEEAQETVKQP
jgi:pyruvate dehydrogenase E1 component alpha subunit